MRTLTLREREAIGVGPGSELTDSDAVAFARLESSFPAGTISWEHRKIRFGPFCGVLRAGDVVVELLPKIDQAREPDDSARGVLVAMLRSTGALTVSKAGESMLGQQRMHLLDIFILDFCHRVNAALRGGAIARYQEHNENLKALRGRIRLTDHLRLNAFDQSRLFCGYDERTTDNPYNRALKGVLGRLLPQTVSPQVRAHVAALLHRFDEVARVEVTPLDIENLAFDRMVQRWQPVFERAKWLLQGLFPDVRVGRMDGICLLFNIERLFQAFVGSKLRLAWQSQSYERFRVRYQGPQLSLAQSEAGDAFLLRPDIVVLNGERVVRIFDAKWKRLDATRPNSGISPSDVYQLTSYASRYQCGRVALVYPASDTCRPGLIDTFTLEIPNSPILEIHAVDVRALAKGAPLAMELRPYPSGVDGLYAEDLIVKIGGSRRRDDRVHGA